MLGPSFDNYHTQVAFGAALSCLATAIILVFGCGRKDKQKANDKASISKNATSAKNAQSNRLPWMSTETSNLDQTQNEVAILDTTQVEPKTPQPSASMVSLGNSSVQAQDMESLGLLTSVNMPQNVTIAGIKGAPHMCQSVDDITLERMASLRLLTEKKKTKKSEREPTSVSFNEASITAASRTSTRQDASAQSATAPLSTSLTGSDTTARSVTAKSGTSRVSKAISTTSDKAPSARVEMAKTQHEAPTSKAMDITAISGRAPTAGRTEKAMDVSQPQAATSARKQVMDITQIRAKDWTKKMAHARDPAYDTLRVAQEIEDR